MPHFRLAPTSEARRRDLQGGNHTPHTAIRLASCLRIIPLQLGKNQFGKRESFSGLSDSYRFETLFRRTDDTPWVRCNDATVAGVHRIDVGTFFWVRELAFKSSGAARGRKSEHQPHSGGNCLLAQPRKQFRPRGEWILARIQGTAAVPPGAGEGGRAQCSHDRLPST